MAPKWEAVERRHDVSCKSERRRSLPRFFNVNLRARSELRKQLRSSGRGWQAAAHRIRIQTPDFTRSFGIGSRCCTQCDGLWRVRIT